MAKTEHWWDRAFSQGGWLRALVIWGAIGIFLLFFGGLAAQGYLRLMTQCPASGTCSARITDWTGLALLSLGGGVALGLIGVALSLANPRGVGWGLGMVVIGALLFIIFVWPTPYKYYRTKDRQLIRVHRVTGAADYVPGYKLPEAASASAPQR
jgi:hypothetical protein